MQDAGYAFDLRKIGSALWCGDDVPFEGDYVEPDDLEAAVALLRNGGRSVCIIAGGQSILPALRSGMLQAARLVSLRRIPALSSINRLNTTISIGAMVTFTDFLASEHAASLPLLTQAITAVGNHTIRNRTTFGGTVAWANPMAALHLSLSMLDAIVVTTHRRIPAVDCVAGVNRNSLMVGEIIVAVEIALPPPSRRFAFKKTTARRSGGKALASVAVGLEHGKGRHRSIRLGVVGLREQAWISPWSSCAASDDLLTHTDNEFGQAPSGRRFDPLLPDPSYMRRSAALVCRSLVQDLSNA